MPLGSSRINGACRVNSPCEALETFAHQPFRLACRNAPPRSLGDNIPSNNIVRNDKPINPHGKEAGPRLNLGYGNHIVKRGDGRQARLPIQERGGLGMRSSAYLPLNDIGPVCEATSLARLGDSAYEPFAQVDVEGPHSETSTLADFGTMTVR